MAQACYFIAIICSQWADVLASKTRYTSVLTQGLRNNTQNFSMIFETGLGLFLIFIPELNRLLLATDS